MKSLLLTMRSESLPERFKRSIIDCLIEVGPVVDIHEEVKLEKKEREARKVRNVINILMSNYEILCRRLIEYGVPDFYALRNIMDIVVDLSTEYGIRFRFKSLMLEG
ncbi:MAG: hypothetical protein QXY59_05015 [Candidatus Korarchaeota archaeon]